MEFCPELAIFHSSANLANRLYSDGLDNFISDGRESENVLQIVCQSVAEITSGLSADITAEEADHWNLMLTALSTWNSISVMLELDRNCPIPSHIVRLIRPLPKWNACFYYNLIKHNSWINYFVQVIDAMEGTGAVAVADVILNHFNESASLDVADLSILIGLLEYFCLFENKITSSLFLCDSHGQNEVIPDCSAGKKSKSKVGKATGVVMGTLERQSFLQHVMCCGNTVNTKDSRNEYVTVNLEKGSGCSSGETSLLLNLLRAVLKMLKVEALEQLLGGNKIRLLTAVLNLITLIFGEDILLLGNKCLFEADSLVPNYSEPLLLPGFYASNGSSDACTFSLNCNGLPLKRLKLLRSFTFNVMHMETVNKILPLAEVFARGFYDMQACLCQKELNNVNSLVVTNSVTHLSLYRTVFLFAYSHLHAGLDLIKDIDLRHALHLFLMNLHSTCIDVAQFVQCLESNDFQPKQMFEHALTRIEKNFPDSKDYFNWLVEADCIEVLRDPRWLKCVESCCDVVPQISFEEKTIVSLLLAFKKLRNDNHYDSENLNRLRLAILKVYHHLSLDQHEIILSQFYGGSELSPFDMDFKGFQRRFSETFRELTSVDKSGFKDKIKDVSCLVLQHPLETINELILSVVQSKQYSDIFLEILSQLPVLAKLKTPNGCLVIIDYIRNFLSLGTLSRTARLHAIALCRRLLLTGTDQKALCSTEEFLQTCIFSQNHHLVATLDSESDLSSATQTLNFILVAFESPEKRKIDWPLISSYSVLPLMAWVCHVIDSCQIVWPKYCDGSFDRVEVKETALRALTCLLGTMSHCVDEIPAILDVHIDWLWLQLSQLHWTVLHHLQEFFSITRFGDRMFPRALANFLNGSDQQLTENILFMLFDLCRVSDSSTEIVVNSLRSLAATSVPCNFYGRVVFNLSQVLTNSIKCEWFHIAEILKQLILKQFIPWKISSSPELSVCHIFVDGILVIRESLVEYNDELFISFWLYLVQCFAEYFKHAVLSCKKHVTVDEVSFAKVSLDLMIRLWCIVPKAGTIPLRNLILEVSTLLSSMMSKGTSSVANNDIHCALAEVNRIILM